MARLLDAQAEQFYAQELEDLGSHKLKDAQRRKKKRSADALADEPPAPSTARDSVQDHMDPLSSEQSEDGEQSGEDDEDEDGTSSEDGSSDGASDLDGLPLASAVAAEALASGKKKKAKQGTAQSITEEGASSKIGIAFSRILEGKTKQGVMSASKSVQKRKNEDEEERAQQMAAKQQRKELRRRGRMPVLPKGQDPAQDARERTLISVATKGVVQLFNAVSKAQQARWNSDALGEKDAQAVKATKAALLKVLKAEDKPTDEQAAPGWKALQKGFTGFRDASKMKDFDREASDEASAGDEVEDPEESDDSDDLAEW